MEAGRRHAIGIVARALLLLPLFLAAWHFAAPVLSWVPGKMAVPVVRTMAGRVDAMTVRDGAVHYALRLQTPYGRGPIRNAEVEVEVRARHYTYGIALFLALAFAARESREPVRIFIGCATLLLLPVVGVASDALKQLGATAALAPFIDWGGAWREAIALGYQVGSLLVPTVVPVVLWMALNPAAWAPPPSGTPSPDSRTPAG